MILGFERRQAVVYIMRAVCAFFVAVVRIFRILTLTAIFGEYRAAADFMIEKHKVVREYHANKKIQVIQYEALDLSQTT